MCFHCLNLMKMIKKPNKKKEHNKEKEVYLNNELNETLYFICSPKKNEPSYKLL